MANNSKKEKDLGFIPLEDTEYASNEEDLGFTPLEEASAEAAMAEAAFPTLNYSSEDIPTDQYLKETGEDIITTLPQGVTSWADEAQAAAMAAYGKAKGRKEKLPELYQEEVSRIRENLGRARERSPFATAAGELGAGIGTSLIPGIGPLTGAGKFGGIGGMAARGAFEGAGTSESTDPFEMGTFAGIGGALGGLGGIVSKGFKEIATASPERIRAGVLGAKTTQFKEIGIKERENIAKEMKDLGLFQKRKATFDRKKFKWIPSGSTLENIEKPTRDKLLERIDDAFKITQEEKLKALGPSVNLPVDQEVLENELEKVVIKYGKKRTGREGRLVDAGQVKEDILQDIMSDMEEMGGDRITVKLLEDSKQRLQEDVGSYGRDPLLSKIPDASSLYNEMYAAINNTLKKEIVDPNYAKANALQSKFYTVKSDLKGAMAAESPKFNPLDFKSWTGSPETQLDIARAAEVMNLPGLKQMKRPLGTMISEAPFSAIRFLDPSTPYTERLTPMSLTEYKIPRSTKGILENKDKVYAKLVQMGVNEEILGGFKEAVNKDAKLASKALPALIMSMPEIKYALEPSDYHTFDGVFLDPNDRAAAADFTSKRDDINSIQKAKIINSINKKNAIEGDL